MEKRLKNIQTFEQHSSELNISDVISRLNGLKRQEIVVDENDIRLEERDKDKIGWIYSPDLDEVIKWLESFNK